MSTAFEPVIFRPLPRPLAPFPEEALGSYWRRLADANRVPVDRLKVPSRWLQSAPDSPAETVRRLALLTGQSPAVLWRALPELTWWQEAGFRAVPGSAGREPRWACRRCAAAHAPGQQIVLFAPARHHHVCMRHGLWVGKAAHRPQDQVDLAQLPATIRAQRWHHRLIRRHGDALITQCLDAARGLWQKLAAHCHSLGTDEIHNIVHKQPGARSGWGPGLYAMAYPGMVAAMSMAATPFWRSVVAHSGHPDDISRLLAEFYRRLPHDTILRADHDLDRLGQECAMVMRRIDRYFDGRRALAQQP